MTIQSFPKAHRLLKSASYKDVLENGEKFYTKNFLVFFKENQLKETRLGLVFSRKTGKANIRNRAKRVIREYFRTQHLEIYKNLPCHDVVFIGKKNLNREIQYEDVKKQCEDLYQKYFSLDHPGISVDGIGCVSQSL